MNVGHFPRLKSVGQNRRNLKINWVGLGAIALFSGMAMGLTNAPTNWWPLAWVAQTPLWLLLYHHAFCRSLPPAPPLLPPLFWAMGYYGTTLIWITGLHPLTWMGIPWVASVAIALSCWAIVTLWGCLWSVIWAIGFTTILRWLGHQPGLFAMATRVLVGTALWCGLDTLWSQGILYWPTLALTQSPSNLWVLQLNQLSGPITTTALIVMINGLLAEFCHPFLTNPPRSNRPTLRTTLRSPALLLTLLLMAIAHLLGAWLYLRPPIPGPTPENALAIGLIQGNIPTQIKLTRAGIQQAFDRYTQGYDQLVDQGADLVVLPEGAIPLVWDGSKTAINAGTNPVAQRVGDRHTPALIGTFTPVPSSSGSVPTRAITQSLLMVVPTTLPGRMSADPAMEPSPATVQVMSQYNKVKLVPLGEYIPAEGILGAIVTRLSPMQSTMVPGSREQRLQTPWGGAIAGICYESAFPELFRQQTQQGGEFMITAANNDPYNGAMMAQHHAQDVMRAVESDRWMVRVTNTGYSGVVSPRGETMWQSERNKQVVHLAHIQRRQSRTLYVTWGNWLTILLISLAGMMVSAQRFFNG